MQIRDARPADIPAITRIYNHAVEHTTAIWNDRLVDEADRRVWLEDRQRSGYPVLVMVGAADASARDEVVLGYASYGGYRAFDGYRHTVEHSVYVREDQRGKRLGEQLMRALIDRARDARVHVMVAAIEAENTASIGLHQKLGFQPAGVMREVGTKFGRWLDLAHLTLTLHE